MAKVAIIVLKLVPEADTEGEGNDKIRKEIEHELNENPLPWQSNVERVVIGDVS